MPLTLKRESAQAKKLTFERSISCPPTSKESRGLKMVREKMTCLLCRGLISFKDRNQTRFLDHMKQEHNVRYDFNILLVATLLSEAEKSDIVETNRGKFEPQNVETKSENQETYLIVEEENSSTEPLIECKFCNSKVSSRLDLKNHMMKDHAAKTDKPNDQVEAKTAIPAAKESIVLPIGPSE